MQPRYANVARELAEAIGSGRYPVGSLLPPEVTLAEQLGVSRSTVRAAMRELQATGLISRRKSVGTRVEAAGPPEDQPGFFQAIGSIAEVQQFGDATIRRTVEVTDEVADDVLATRLGVRPGSRWLRVSSLRLWRDRPDDPPVCWTDVYIAADFAEGVRSRLGATTDLLSTLIEETSGRRILEIRQQLRALPVPTALADPLKADVGAAALEVRRQYLLGPATLAEVSISIHPGDRFAYSTRLTRRD
ncbi:GntR family transcriptional regulator [Amaricoccus sp. W119]|uniref:GntR family transcriptional regulator n=1 Tax=Amaricoccus sp. W119 TaxID=3391833 RepID=UPI0039A46C05